LVSAVRERVTMLPPVELLAVGDLPMLGIRVAAEAQALEERVGPTVTRRRTPPVWVASVDISWWGMPVEALALTAAGP
jgi:hypothetical protein